MISILTVLAGTLLGSGGPVTGLSIVPASQRTEVVISVSGPVEYRDFPMEGPNRLVVDLMGSQHALPADDFAGIDRGGIRSIRTSQYSEAVVRVVLELDELVPYEVVPTEGGLRVILQNPAGPFEPWTTDVAPSTERVQRPASPAANAPPRRTETRGILRQDGEAPRITISFSNSPLRDVLFTFAEFSGKSIVPGSEVSGSVTADIRNQPWDEALRTILESRGLIAQELESGIIRVDNIENLSQRETVEPTITRAFRVNYATAAELQEPLEALLTERGRVSAGAGTNTLIVTDVPRVMTSVEELLAQLDVRIPQINISARIIFVNRTDLNEFGVTYDLKDSQGNQLNTLTTGRADLDGDGAPESVEEDVVLLGGNSVAALGNARQRVVSPSIQVLSSLLVGRHTLVSFIEALESTNLSEIEAAPSTQVLDNQQARILVGERTPLRVVDASAAGAGGQGGAAPTATVQLQETGILLEVTPHVTAANNILLDLRAERSAAELAESDAGFIFRTQEAQTRVLLKDGETAVIGGLTVTENTEVRTGIPLLMDLPLIGRLFRTTREQTVQRDLMILVTPRIVRGES